MRAEASVTNNAVFEQLAQVRRNLVERMWRSFFLLSLLLLPILIWRTAGIVVSGQANMLTTNIVFITVAVCILIAFPLRRRIPFAIRAAMPVLILSVVGLVSLIVFGAASIAFGWMVQSNFLLSTLYSLRAGIIATVITALTATVVGILFLSGVLVNTMDLNAYFLFPTTWILFLLAATVVPTVILYSIGGYQKTIGELLTTVQAKRDQLAELSGQLGDALQAEERANAAKSEFLAHMTHELRTPLSGVIGMLEIADKRNRDPQMAHLLEVAHHNAESLMRIINDVLDFSKIEAGKVTLDPEYFDLKDFVDTSMEVFHLRADEKSILFRHQVDPQLKTVRYGDPLRLRQVLFNLVSNAMKFTDVGRVELEVQPAYPELPGDNRVRFVVRDTGVGIPAAAIIKLFQEFEQADSSVQKRFGGTGLGLVICKMLIQAMGGQVSVDSREGQGSTFEVVLPLPIGPDCPMPCAAAPMQAHDCQLNILLAEDTPTIQMVTCSMLEDMGHRVVVVDDGRAAVLAAARESFDLILMDLRMPELGGCDAAELIRHGGTTDARIVDTELFICAMTANATAQEQKKTVRVGMNDFLTKPVRERTLHMMIGRVIAFQKARGVALVPALQQEAVDLAQFETLLQTNAQEPAQTWLSAGRLAAIQLTPGNPASNLQAVFRADVQAHLNRLMPLVAEANWPQVREVAHALCGAAAALGQEPLRAAAAQLETACQQADTRPCPALATQLMDRLSSFLVEEHT